MTDKNTIRDRVQAVSEKIKALLAEVDEQRTRIQALYQRIGIQPNDLARYLQSDQVSAAQREQVEREIAAFRAEVENEIRQAAELTKSQENASRVRIHPNRVRI